MPRVSRGALTEFAQQMVAGVLQRLCVPFLLIDQVGNIQFANSLSEAVLADGKHLARCGAMMVPTAPDARRALERYLAGLGEDNAGIDLELAALDSAPPLFVTLCPYRPPELVGMALLQPMVVVFIREADEHEGFDMARQRYGLSETETEVMREIVGGRSVGDLARRRGVTEHTVRKQVNAVLRKVGVSRQAQLGTALNKLTGRGRGAAAAHAMAAMRQN